MPHRHIMATHLPDCVQHYPPPSKNDLSNAIKVNPFYEIAFVLLLFFKISAGVQEQKDWDVCIQAALRGKGATAACFIHHDRGRTQSRGVLQFSAGWGKKTLMGANRAIPAHLPPSLQQALPNLFFSFFFFFWQMINKSFPLERFVRLCWICLPPFWAGEAVQTWASILPHTSAPSLPPALTASISLSPTNTHTRRTMHTFAQHRCPPLPLITALLLWSALQLMCALLARCWINCAMLSLWMAWVSAKPCNPPHPRAPLHNFWLKLVQRERAHMHPCAHTDPCGHTSRCSWSTEQLAQSCDAPCAA